MGGRIDMRTRMHHRRDSLGQYTRLGHAMETFDLDVLEVGPAGLSQSPRVAQVVEFDAHLVAQIRFLEFAKALIAPVPFFPARHARTSYVAYCGSGVPEYGMTIDLRSQPTVIG